MKDIAFRPFSEKPVSYWTVLILLAVVAAVAYLSAHHMETEGHWITGMSNQVVWGTPHVFAVFLIVAASGALNIASIGSVFAKGPYQPLARMSGILAIALLIGGLLVLVLDLGRPDRLIVAMTYYNFKSIFAWNIILYVGFIVIVGAYVWTMVDRSREVRRWYKPAAFAAFFWRLVLTTGTGSIFGFLVARAAYDTAILAPTFIVMSFAYGLAIFMVMILVIDHWSGRVIGENLFRRLKNLLAVFVAGALFLVFIYHVTKLYGTKYHGFEEFILVSGGLYPWMFWVGQVLLGSLAPIALIFMPFTAKSRLWVGVASVLVIVGGLMQMYVTIIGGQAYPLPIFPNYDVTSSFFDGVIAEYLPSIWEILLGIGGFAIAVILTMVLFRVLPIVPLSVLDEPARS
jgi:Ni/Fe-hydrogenase subunit HybB-like protein